MAVSNSELSRAVSHALRHAPWLYELELDEEGWVPVDQLLAGLRAKGADWEALDEATLERMVAHASKRRHEISDGRIRALYGHSTPRRIARVRAVPPALLYHGTSPNAWSHISVSGLRPMGRQYVHLSGDEEMAIKVGRRKSTSPLILHVHADRASESGVAFYTGNDQVWLADFIPAEFIEPVSGNPGGDVRTADINFNG